MCQDKNEVISYYRYIIIPGQVRGDIIIKYRFQFGNEETFTRFKIKLRVTWR